MGGPEPLNEEEVVADVERYKSIAAILDQDGGKVLVEGLRASVTSDINRIIALFSAPEMELRCAVAKLKADLDLYHTLVHARPNAEVAQEALAGLLGLDKKNESR